MTMEIPAEYKRKKKSLYQDNEALEKVAKRGYAAPIFESFWGTSAYSLNQPGLTQSRTCSEQEVGRETSCNPF